MRIDSTHVPSFDHFGALQGHGFGDIHLYNPKGAGWFSSLVSAAAPVLKHVATQALSAGVSHLAQGGDLHGALGAAGSAGKAAALGSAQRKLQGGGYGGGRKRHRPF